MLKKILMASFALCVVSGCGPFWVNPYITVEDSHLNWVHIHYYNLKSSPIRRISLYMSGTGYIKVVKGTSEQVSNDFAKRYEEDTWHDIKISEKHVDTEHLNDIFQNLVNNGLLDREKLFKGTRKKTMSRFIAVKANLNNTTYSENVNIFEADPNLAEVLFDVICQFNNPLQK